MPRGTGSNRIICCKCRKTIRCNQKYSKCKHCLKSFHNNCLFANRKRGRVTNVNWECDICISKLPSANENLDRNRDDESHSSRENINISPILDAHSLNNIFESSLMSSEKTENLENDAESNYVEIFYLDKYLTCEEMRDMFGDFSTKNTFTTLCLNIRSLSNARNFAKLEILMDSLFYKPDVFGVCETWLRPGQTGPYMSLQGYTFIENSRPTNGFLPKSVGGGVGLYIKSGLKYEERPDLKVMNDIMETIGVDIYLGNQKVTILNVYRPPYTENVKHARFFEEFDNMLQNIKNKSKDSYVMGDPNYDLIDVETNVINEFKELMFGHTYSSLINKPTRIAERKRSNSNIISKTATCLDHIWTTIQNYDIRSGILTNAISDHLPVAQVTFLTSKEYYKTAKHMRKVLNKRQSINFTEKLKNANYDKVVNESNTNTAFENLASVITSCIPKIANRLSKR